MNNKYLHKNLEEFNRPERRRASDSIDRASQREREARWATFVGGLIFLLAFSMLITYTLAGWLDAL